MPVGLGLRGCPTAAARNISVGRGGTMAIGCAPFKLRPSCACLRPSTAITGTGTSRWLAGTGAAASAPGPTHAPLAGLASVCGVRATNQESPFTSMPVAFRYRPPPPPHVAEGCAEVEGARPVSEREVVHWFQTLLASANISGRAPLHAHGIDE